MDEVEEITRKFGVWNEPQAKSSREIMTWCNDSDDERAIQIITPPPPNTNNNNEFRNITCPSCGHHIELQDQVIKLKLLFNYSI